MKHSDFHIGLEFVGGAGFHWRCTDVGTRTILAIQLDRKDPHWYQGPPYIAKETVFDEHEIERCHLTETDAITAAVREHKTSGHPGYPSEVVAHMLKARHQDKGGPLSAWRRAAFRSVSAGWRNPPPLCWSEGRRGLDGRVVSAVPADLRHHVSRLNPDFIALPRASVLDVRAQADQ